MSSPGCIGKIRQITEDSDKRRVIVVSAPSGVTDSLISLAYCDDRDRVYGEIVPGVVERFGRAHPGADLDVLRKSLEERLSSRRSGGARADWIKAFGEYYSARLIAESLGYGFVDSADLLCVSGDHGNARILPRSAGRVRDVLSDPSRVYVVPGFYGRKGRGVATFSRGGSDYTAGFIAAALDADVYENFTDRLGVFEADPRVVPGAGKVDVLTFKEMRDLAYSGAKIFHPDAIIPIEDRLRQGHSVRVHIRSTMDYPGQGTFVVSERTGDACSPVVGIAYGDSFCSFDVDMTGLNDEVGLIADVSGVFRDLGLSIEHVATGIDDMSVILKKDGLCSGPGAVADVDARLRGLLQGRGDVRFREHMGCLVVAGKGIKERPTDVTLRMLGALASEGIDYVFTMAGPGKSCIISGIPSVSKESAMVAVHGEFFG